MGLFKPKWVKEGEAKDRAMAKAQMAVERLTDPNDLIRAALESPWGTVQLAAVARLDDAALLAVLNNSAEWYVHEAIVGKLNRQDDLIHYMFFGKYSNARKIALSRVEDQQALRRFILQYSNDPAVAPMMEEAIELITDDYILLDLAQSDKELGSELRRLAVKRISLEPAARQLYAEIQSGQCKADPADLLEGLDAPEFLLELALSETTAPLTRALAVEQIGKLGLKEYATQLAILKGSPLHLGSYPQFHNMTLGEVVQAACAKLCGKSVFELTAETEDEVFLNRQISLLLKKSDPHDRVSYEAMNYIRAFYRAERFRDRIATLTGRVISPHIDHPSERCLDEHFDASEVVFRL